jgi:SAM-dependent methyltransferase
MTYSDQYLNWKSWDSGNFGALSPGDEKYFSREVQRTGLQLPPKAKVLEIGFGSGGFLRYGAKRQWEMTGLEANEKLVDMAKQQGFAAHDSGSLAKFADDTFDLVVAFDVLEHIPQDEMVSFLAGIKRVLKDGGCFLARFPNGDSPFGMLYQNGDPTHVTAMGLGKVKYFARQLDVEVVFVGGQAHSIFDMGKRHLLRGVFEFGLKWIIDAFVSKAIYRRKVAFCSPNMVMVYKILKSSPLKA